MARECEVDASALLVNDLIVVGRVKPDRHETDDAAVAPLVEHGARSLKGAPRAPEQDLAREQ